ncbi:DUF3265 domain-containing protein [Vibrio parahaemolyticus]|nr:DUF3265 domain-containing protein [Vibrio parahaemolyticus]EIU6865404.1 DUF3265 domain-containing protein [Vibrio parahaemolyticus]EIU7065968.1 DUF3265 domain-containing protein [Vibrio parahaemolyticus]ELB2132429.1 DUF3265 domain-containing protein [Vibrio parahaemolyticus]ELB2147346.1 DUF3265 domain-containing protein [Vibrio parahaemolyticus]
MTKHLSAIHNAWHFWFASSFVFKAQCGSRCVLRCSRLNAALVANEENAAQAECLELKSVCFWWGFVLQF